MLPLHTDADGVVLDFSSTFHRFMKEVYGFHTRVNEPRDFFFRDAYPMIDDITPYLISFFEDYDYFSQIKAYPEAQRVLAVLKDMGAAITIVTSCGHTNVTKQGRLDCIEREFGGIIEDVVILPTGKTKESVLKTLPKGVFVDDQIHMCESALLHTEHDIYLHHRRYNALTSHPMIESQQLTRLHSLAELPIAGLRNAINVVHNNDKECSNSAKRLSPR